MFQKELVSSFLEPHLPPTLLGGGTEAGGGAPLSPLPFWVGWVTLHPPRWSPGAWGWRRLPCRSYLKSTGDLSRAFFSPVITSQERLRRPGQVRMRPLTLQMAAQSAPTA